MNSLSLLTSAACVLLAGATTVTVSDCSAGKSVFKIKSLDFTPVNAIPGQNGTLHTLYDVPTLVSGGTSKYSCTLNGLPVYSETFDLCTQTDCPVTAGTHDDYSTSAVPDTSGKLKCIIDWRDTAENQLMCISTVIQYSLRRLRRRSASISASNETVHYSPPSLFLGTNLNGSYTHLHPDEEPYWPAVLPQEDGMCFLPHEPVHRNLRGAPMH
jgi:hypothetical protein